MNVLENFKYIGISMLLAVGLAACDKPGPAESAGKKIDQAAEKAGNKINETVEKVSEKIDTQNEKASVAIDDAEITSKVKAGIYAETGLKTLQISVETVKGVVTLSGAVDSMTSSDRARGVALTVEGVKGVNNRLTVKSPS